MLTPFVGVFAFSEIVQDVRNNPIPVDFEKTIYIYFPYVNSGSESISNSQSTISIKGIGLDFVEEDIFDLYSSNNNEPVVCNSTTNATMNPISPLLVDNKSIIYGLRSAQKNTSGGSNISVLQGLASGCLRIGLKVNTLAKSGSETQVSFNPNSNSSNEYRINPAIQSVYFVFGDPSDMNSTIVENSDIVSIGFDNDIPALANETPNSNTPATLTTINENELATVINSINSPQKTTLQQFLSNGWYILIPLYLFITVVLYMIFGRFKRITMWVNYTTKKLRS